MSDISELQKNLTQLQHDYAQLLLEHDALKALMRQRTLELDRKNKAMEHQSLHDLLTGLANRTLLLERARHAFQIASREKFLCCFIMIGLNGFKEINDSLGHHLGDLVLKEVARRLQTTLRKSDTIARLGGDEFAILLLDTSVEQAEFVVEKLFNGLKKTIELPAGEYVQVNASAGLAFFPDHGDDTFTLMQRADIAMYAAKSKQLNRAIYTPEMDRHRENRLSLAADLEEAIENNGLELYYQPQILAQREGLPSFEALVRWHHPKRGMVYPDMFIPMAEETGLITPMTWWVLDAAAKQCALWRKEGLEVTVSVNLSARNLQEPDMVERVHACLQRYNLPPQGIVLEITESMLMDDPHEASEVLREIAAMQVEVSIDDFGTGYSSLSYLKHLQVNELKIDRSFVMGMRKNEHDMVIIRAIINLAHNLKLRVVAEGVEDDQDRVMLTDMGCDLLQGYFFSRPKPAKDIDHWLKAWIDSHEIK